MRIDRLNIWNQRLSPALNRHRNAPLPCRSNFLVEWSHSSFRASFPAITLVQNSAVPAPYWPLIRRCDRVRACIGVRLQSCLYHSLQAVVVRRVAAHIIPCQCVEFAGQLGRPRCCTGLVAPAEQRRPSAECRVRKDAGATVHGTCDGRIFLVNSNSPPVRKKEYVSFRVYVAESFESFTYPVLVLEHPLKQCL
jgi:hypothetical protein